MPEDEFISIDNLKRIVSPKKYRVLINNSYLGYRLGSKYDTDIEGAVIRVNGGHYHPSRPAGIYSVPKHNYVPRLIPVLDPQDNILYHYLIKQMEEKLLAHKPDSVKSFGAYRILSIAKKSEDEQREYDFIDIDELSIGKYTTSYQWYPEYGEFAETIKNYLANNSDKKVFVKTDIANFYDNIDLRLLENKVRSVLDRDDLSNANLLFRLLQGVNSFAYKYNYQGKGLPQDETSDCSRLLSNFFLYDFDKEFDKACNEAGCLYVRYCDDMIIMCNTKKDAQRITHKAAEILNKSSLSLNSAKTKIFDTRKKFEDYWLFDQHSQLDEFRENLEDQPTYDRAQAVVVGSYKQERGYQLIKRWAKQINPSMVNNTKLVGIVEKYLILLDAHTVAKYLKKQTDPATKERLMNSLYRKSRTSNYTGDLLWFRKVCEVLGDKDFLSKIDRYMRIYR